MHFSSTLPWQVLLLASQTLAKPVPGIPVPGDLSSREYIVRQTDACNAIADAMPTQLFWPNSTQYTTEVTAVWSKTCVLSPYCVFEPDTVQDLSDGVKLIRKANAKFSVRSGGHMPVPGAQSLNDGVFISMSKFNQNSLNSDSTIASIGPGQTWGDVYSWTSSMGLAVNGGRFPPVGVGGVLMGGGIGYFSSEQGWGVDDIVSHQVVLADGSIVETSANNTYNDLFWALKGGHNNFGIVTRFDVRTFSMGAAFGGLASWSAAAQEDFFDAISSYMAPGGGNDDPKSAINAFAQVVPADGASSYALSNSVMYAANVDKPRALENFTNIPEDVTTVSAISLHDSWTDIPAQLTPFGNRDQRHLFSSVSFKGDAQAISIHNTTIIDNALRDLSDIVGLTIYAVWQPISKSWLQASKVKGGNTIDLDPETDGGIIAGIIMAFWDNADYDERISEYSQNAVKEIQEKTSALGLGSDFIYLNDADGTQKPFDVMGHGASLPKLKTIQAKYDPQGFLENNLQHGFPL